MASEGQVHNVIQYLNYDSRSFDLAVSGKILDSTELAAVQSRTICRES